MELLEIYEEYGALLKGHFLLSSGMHSDRYLQSEQVLQYPDIATKLIAPLVQKLERLDFSTIVSPAIGGIRFGYELARQCSKRSIFTERVDGVMQLRRGFSIQQGERVIVAEDVVTTGKSTKECIATIESFGGNVIAIVSLIDRSIDALNFSSEFIALAKVVVNNYHPDNCPICKLDGTIPIKPGSRV